MLLTASILDRAAFFAPHFSFGLVSPAGEAEVCWVLAGLQMGEHARVLRGRRLDSISCRHPARSLLSPPAAR